MVNYRFDKKKKSVYSSKQLESIARWILEESSNPIDEIQELLSTHMLLEPKLFADIWEDVIEEIELKENYINPPITQGDIMLNKMLKDSLEKD